MKSHNAELIEKIRSGEDNPFHTAEAIGEHVNACWGALAKMGMKVWENQSSTPERPKGRPGDITYHLRAIDEYQQELFGTMAALLPALHDWSEGSLNAADLLKLKRELTELAKWHQARWDTFHSEGQ